MRSWLTLLVLMALAGCKTLDPLASDPQELERTWLDGHVFIPGQGFGGRIGNPVIFEKLGLELAGKRLPAIIYAHGCGGFGFSEPYAPAGFPGSRGRASRDTRNGRSSRG